MRITKYVLIGLTITSLVGVTIYAINPDFLSGFTENDIKEKYSVDELLGFDDLSEIEKNESIRRKGLTKFDPALNDLPFDIRNMNVFSNPDSTYILMFGKISKKQFDEQEIICVAFKDSILYADYYFELEKRNFEFEKRKRGELEQYIAVKEKNGAFVGINMQKSGIYYSLIISRINNRISNKTKDMNNVLFGEDVNESSVKSCYDENELDMIHDGKMFYVPKGKGVEQKYVGKNIEFTFRVLNDNVGGELILNGKEYIVSGLYTGEGMYFGSISRLDENYGVINWDYGKCMSIFHKMQCEEREFPVCRESNEPFGDDANNDFETN